MACRTNMWKTSQMQSEMLKGIDTATRFKDGITAESRQDICEPVSMNSVAITRSRQRHLWAVLLAGGDGVRLRGLTAKIVGDHRPKQFCPITGADTLLSQTRR